MSQLDLFDRYMHTVERLYSFETIRKKAECMFTSGNFTRRGGDISALMKARLTAIVLWEYLLTLNRDKRKLLFFIVEMIRSKKLAIDRGMAYMIAMLGYNRHIREHKRNMKEYRDMVSKQDKGSWRVQMQRNNN